MSHSTVQKYPLWYQRSPFPSPPLLKYFHLTPVFVLSVWSPLLFGVVYMCLPLADFLATPCGAPTTTAFLFASVCLHSGCCFGNAFRLLNIFSDA